MAKLTPPKSPIVYDNKHHSGCMWSLYSLFEFRQGNSSQKLISDKKRVLQRDVLIDDGNINKPGNLLIWFGEKSQRNSNELNKEEMKSIHSTSELGELPKKNIIADKPSQRVSDPVKQKKLPHPNIVGTSTDKLELSFGKKDAKKKKKKKKNLGCSCKNVDFVKYEDQLLKTNDVAEAIVNQKLIEGNYLIKDGVNRQSKQLLDALEILNSNKELFTKLLQDPNSLLVKHIQDLRDSQLKKQDSKLLECESSNSKRFHPIEDPQSSEIVVLKPDQSSFEEHTRNSRPIHFSFGDVKRKFKHAMGVTRKDLNLMTIEHTDKVRNKYMENYSFDANRSDKIEKLRDFKARIGKEMAVRNGSETSNFIQNNFQRITMSSPEYDLSPGRDMKSGSVASHMRFSPYGYSQVAYDNWKLAKEQNSSYTSSLNQNIETMIDCKKLFSHLEISHTKVFEADSSLKGETNQLKNISKLSIEKCDSDKLISSGNFFVVDTSNVTVQKETNLSKEPCNTINSETSNTSEEIEDSESSRMDSSLEDQSSTCSSNVFPSTPSSIHRVDVPDRSKDIGESSPISVLERFFTDVACTQSKTCHHDEEQKSCTHSTTYGRISEYVKAVSQQPSCLNQDKPVWDSRVLDNKLLGQSFIEAINSKENQFRGDCKLVFDCVSDVLIELHDTHFRHTPWLSSSLNQKTLQLPEVEMFVAREVMKRVEFFFKHDSSPQRSLEWLVGNDLRQSKVWLDIQTDTEDIVYEIAEDGLDELIMETIVDLYI